VRETELGEDVAAAGRFGALQQVRSSNVVDPCDDFMPRSPASLLGSGDDRALAHVAGRDVDPVGHLGVGAADPSALAPAAFLQFKGV
jgi:hypothetical protein